jgi:2-methylisocitrate lyase-like PEP mutase family enzyme
MLEHLEAIVAATDLPVSADLQNGFSDAPEGVAETISMAVGTGVVGASIEDASGNEEAPLYSIEMAADRIRAAAEVAKAQRFPFMLTARAENFLVGHNDLGDMIRRLQAYEEAGADVLYAPGLSRPQDIATILGSVDRPLNVVMGLGKSPLTRGELEKLGVKRISVGSALARAAYGAVERAAEEMLSRGAFSFADAAIPYQRINSLFAVKTATPMT